MKTPTYTLIIPHFNSPSLLDRLLSTVPFREDLQVIVVDDCSTKDNNIYEDLKNNYSNVTFYNTGCNGGGGKARNIGLLYAKGKYIMFADSDDYFTPGINSILDKYRKNTDYDIIYFNAQAVDSDTYAPSSRANHLQKFIKLYSLDPEAAILKLRFLFGEPWCKLIKRELIQSYDIHFEETPVHNDTFFSYMVGFYAASIAVDNITAYTLTERPISVSTYPFSNRLLIKAEVFAKKNRFLADNHIKIFDPIMLTPFRMRIKGVDIYIKELFSIVEKYGYSKFFIIRKLLIYYINRILNFFRKK